MVFRADLDRVISPRYVAAFIVSSPSFIARSRYTECEVVRENYLAIIPSVAANKLVSSALSDPFLPRALFAFPLVMATSHHASFFMRVFLCKISYSLCSSAALLHLHFCKSAQDIRR